MSSDNFYAVARKLAELQGIVKDSFAATIQELENSAAVRLQKALQASPVAAFEKQAEEAAAKLRAAKLIASHAAERLRAFDSVAAQAAERFRAAYENSPGLQAFAKAEKGFGATVAAQRYLDEQAAQWDRLRNSLVHEVEAQVLTPQPGKFTIKAQLPKIHISAQAKQEYIPAPAAEPKIEMPPVHWLASALDFVLTKGAFKRTVEPILVDVYDEYYELIVKGEEGRAKWIVARGCLLVIWGQIVRPLVALTGWFTILRGG